jgi:hypothetical protein
MFQSLTPAVRWFLLVTILIVVAPYVFGVSPRTRRQWFYIVLTLVFIAWILPFTVSLR